MSHSLTIRGQSGRHIQCIIWDVGDSQQMKEWSQKELGEDLFMGDKEKIEAFIKARRPILVVKSGHSVFIQYNSPLAVESNYEYEEGESFWPAMKKRLRNREPAVAWTAYVCRMTSELGLELPLFLLQKF